MQTVSSWSRSIILFPISGALLFLAEPSPALGPLAFFALIPMIHAAASAANYKRAALGGFIAGMTFFFPALVWLTSTTVLGYIALSLYCAVYFAAFAALTRRTTNAFVLAAAWIGLEFVRGVVAFTGFPWILLSHTQADFAAFTQILDVIGSYGLSGVLVVINILLYRAVMQRSWRPLAATAGVFAVVCGYGVIRWQTVTLSRAHRVGMAQASVPQEMKEQLEGTYDPEGVFRRYVEASTGIPKEPKVDLLVWPETVVLSPYTLNVDPAVLGSEGRVTAQLAQETLALFARNHGAYFLAGAQSFLPADYGYVSDFEIARKIPDGNWRKAYNSAYLFDQNGRYVDRYDKVHLVPFGEYVPLDEIFPFLASLVPFDASLTAGERQTIFKMTKGEQSTSFGVLICYEDTDSELARRLRRNGADFLVNISNDAWFGLTELDQHFVAARYRAIENRAGVVRSGNNGISGLIDPLGRAEVLLDKNAIGGRAGDLWITDSRSVYVWSGDWPAVLFAVATLGTAALRGRLKRQTSDSFD
jgi:apolipoprotein N-acyltransferase